MSETTAQLLALAVHELRNPVSVILGYVRMLAEGRAGALSHRQRDLLEDLERSAQELSQLLKELSDLANVESRSTVFAKQELSLKDLVEPVVGQMRAVGIEPPLNGATARQVVAGDSLRLQAALGAILTTISENLDPGEPVCVRPSLRRAGGRTRVRLTAGTAAAVKTLAGAAASRLERFSVAGGRGSLASMVGCSVIRAHGGDVWMTRHQRRPQDAVIELPVRPAERRMR